MHSNGMASTDSERLAGKRLGREVLTPKVPEARPGYRWVELPEAIAASFQHVGVLTREQFDDDYGTTFDLLLEDPPVASVLARHAVRDALLLAAALGHAEVGPFEVTFDRVRGYSVELTGE
jgi:hypothetical protein